MYPYLFSFDVNKINNIEDLYGEIDDIKDKINSYRDRYNQYDPHWLISEEIYWYFGSDKYGKYMIYTPIIPNPPEYKLSVSSINAFSTLGGDGISYISIDEAEKEGVPFLNDTLSTGILPERVKSYGEKDYMEDRNNAIQNGILSNTTLSRRVNNTDLVNINKFMDMVKQLDNTFTNYFSNNYTDLYPAKTEEWYLNVVNKNDIFLNVPMYGLDENTVNERIYYISRIMNLQHGSFETNNIIYVEDLPQNANLSKYILSNISSISAYEYNIDTAKEYNDVINILLNMDTEEYLNIINLVNRKKVLND
ncbi:Hypothetical protein ORPV_1156 [Orpheovirus IHUMI-LCC2]|uniref:Uncharacterized protein n=1 Tax=Orpheovirus IHUMI-LCC2 TaxID=2023057 RepID=A0A2I2L6E0_9VIRU|nr:Hypothetical protein ORPV_1156 [Orpheovirus IHUMI-LCC2]SNW63060.1 Hypothetical protein ORPV_1156 [Orpheovirus IHUMI-LCC2]